MAKVIETRDGWMIRCRASCQWHEFPKNPTAKGHRWSFNGDLENPTFSPSMNETRNWPGPHHNPDAPSSRCHFIVSNGRISYCSDCTHDLRGQSFPLEEWPPEKVAYYAELKEHGWP